MKIGFMNNDSNLNYLISHTASDQNNVDAEGDAIIVWSK